MPKCKCHVWGDKFWNNFFQPRHPGVFIILMTMVGAIIFTCAYVLLAIYIGGLTMAHADAYLIIFVANFVIIVDGFLIIHFLTLRSEDLTVLRCAVLYLILLLALVLGVTAIAKFNANPTNAEMKDYVHRYFETHYAVSQVMQTIHQEKKCCGATGFKDFVSNPKNVSKLPDTCCKKVERYCGNFHKMGNWKTVDEIESSGTFYTDGCFVGKTYNDLNSISPRSYMKMQLVINFSLLNLLIVLIVLIVYSYYVCYKMPKEDEQPRWADDFFQKIASPFKQITSKCFSQAEIPKSFSISEGRASTEFENRHSLIRRGASFVSADTDGTASAGTVSIEGLVDQGVRPTGSSAMDISQTVKNDKEPSKILTNNDNPQSNTQKKQSANQLNDKPDIG